MWAPNDMAPGGYPPKVDFIGVGSSSPSRCHVCAEDQPAIGKICRTSYQDAAKMMKLASVVSTQRRRETDDEARKNFRQKAREWRTVSHQAAISARLKEKWQQALLEDKGAEPDSSEAEAPPAPRPPRVKAKKARKLPDPASMERARSEARTYRFFSYPDQVRECVQTAFQLYSRPPPKGCDTGDVAEGGGSSGPAHCVPPEDLYRALAATGVQPVSWDEWRMLGSLKLRDLEFQDPRGCDIEEFGVEVYGRAHRAIVNERRRLVKESILICNRSWEGRLDSDELAEALKQLLPPVVLDEELSDEDSVDLVEKARRVAEHFTEREGTREGSVSNLIDEMLRLGQERPIAMAAKAGATFANRDLSSEDYRDFVPQVHELASQFDRLEGRRAGFLLRRRGKAKVSTESRDEIRQFMSDLGLMPTVGNQQQREVLAVMDEMQTLTFAQLLDLIKEIRRVCESSSDAVLDEAFKAAAALDDPCKDVRSGARVSVKRLRTLLEDRGVITGSAASEVTMSRRLDRLATSELKKVIRETSARVSDDLAMVLWEIDPAAEGMYTYDQVRRIIQLLQERSRRREVRRKNRKIQACGYKPEEIEELKIAFNQLDTDGSGSLDKQEVRKVLGMLRVKFHSEVKFHIAFAGFDQDRNGTLEWVEFLQLTQMIRDKAGVFGSDANIPVTSLEALERSSLLQVMDIIGLGFDKADALSSARLVEEACKALNVTAGVSLTQGFGVQSLADLLELVRSRVS